MGSPEAIFLFSCYLLSPLAVRLGAWYFEGIFRGFISGAAVLLAIIWGNFLASFFISHIFYIQGAALWLVSLVVAVFLAFLEWRFIRWVESLISAEGQSKESVYQQIKGEIAHPLTRLVRKLGGMESTIGKMAKSTDRRYTEVSASVGQMEENFSKLVTNFNDIQSGLGGTREEVAGLINEFKNFQKKIQKAGTVEHGRSSVTHESPASTPRRLTTDDGRQARLSGREWQRKAADYIKQISIEESIPIEIENHPEKGEPDFIIRAHGKVRVVGACKAYTLRPYQPGAHRTIQRTILPSMVVVEVKSALKYKLPLFITVVNQRTGVLWFHIIPHKELDSFERITTFSWFAEDNPPEEEIERNHREFIEFLKGLV